MYWLSIRYSIYCGLSFFVCLGCYLPSARFFAVLLIVSYLCYAIFDTVKTAMEDENDGLSRDTLIKSAILNTPDLVAFVASIAIGIYAGVSR